MKLKAANHTLISSANPQAEESHQGNVWSLKPPDIHRYLSTYLGTQHLGLAGLATLAVTAGEVLT